MPGAATSSILGLILAITLQSPAQPPASPAPPATPAPPAPASTTPPYDGPESPVITHHELRAGGKTLRYTATTGFLPIRSAQGDVEARMFFIAYTLDGADPAGRPLTISFNGGPGSSSVWLHLGALGPKRVAMNDDGTMPAPPYRLVDNEATWLDQTDLVFVDPVGTGW